MHEFPDLMGLERNVLVPLSTSPVQKSFTWYKAASVGGEKRAAAMLKSIAHLVTPEQISRADSAAAEIPTSRQVAGSERPSQSEPHLAILDDRKSSTFPTYTSPVAGSDLQHRKELRLNHFGRLWQSMGMMHSQSPKQP
jgi:hypothetical protein